MIISIKFIRGFFLAFLLGILCSIPGKAQDTVYNCMTSIADFNTDTSRTIERFTIDTNQNPLVVKSSPFMKTNLFINASFFYFKGDPEDAASSESQIVLTLALSKKKYSVIETEMKKDDVIANARTMIPVNSFKEAEVSTFYLGKPQLITISLECKRQ